jgi:hypothetical protein
MHKQSKILHIFGELSPPVLFGKEATLARCNVRWASEYFALEGVSELMETTRQIRRVRNSQLQSKLNNSTGSLCSLYFCGSGLFAESSPLPLLRLG